MHGAESHRWPGHSTIWQAIACIWALHDTGILSVLACSSFVPFSPPSQCTPKVHPRFTQERVQTVKQAATSGAPCSCCNELEDLAATARHAGRCKSKTSAMAETVLWAKCLQSSPTRVEYRQSICQVSRPLSNGREITRHLIIIEMFLLFSISINPTGVAPGIGTV